MADGKIDKTETPTSHDFRIPIWRLADSHTCKEINFDFNLDVCLDLKLMADLVLELDVEIAWRAM
jgi:hypothetical protein